jgi:O-antigen/teichoic acid export membrane protein
MVIPNLILIINEDILSYLPPWKESWHTPAVIFRTLRSGFWYYATTISWIVKTHAMTFLVSALAGPAEAGIFYFMLRLTEIIGNVGATASETSLASLASTENVAERRQKFNHCWLYVALFCLPAALIFGFQGKWLLHLWFVHQSIGWTIGLGMAIFGLAGAFSRVVVFASMGLRLIKRAALSNLAEATVNIIFAVMGYEMLGLPGVFFGGCLGVIVMLLPAKDIAALCGEPFSGAFIWSLSSLAVGMGIIAITQAGAAWTDSVVVKFAAIALAGVITLVQLRHLHR